MPKEGKYLLDFIQSQRLLPVLEFANKSQAYTRPLSELHLGQARLFPFLSDKIS
jgi:hypothetical protein